MKKQTVTPEQIKQKFEELTNITFELAHEIADNLPEDNTWLTNYVMEHKELGYSAKLFLVYLINNDLTDFQAASVYQKLGIHKAHFLKFIKQPLSDMGYLKEVNRTWMTFINPAKVF